MPTHTLVAEPTEAEFQRHVIATLRTFGYLATTIRRSDGVTIGDIGLPDILAVHPITGAFLALELKVGKANATPHQLGWLGAFSRPRVCHAPDVGQHVAAADLAIVVRPSGWPDVAKVCARLAGHRVAA